MATASSDASLRGQAAGAGHDRDRALVQLFLERAEADADRVALRYKEFGIWHELTWRAYRTNVERLALGFLGLGLGVGDRVAVMGRPTPEWLFTDVATQSIGGVTLGLYLTTAAKDVRHQLQDSGARIFVAETQEHVDKLLDAEALAGVELVDHVVVMETQGMLGRRSSRLHSLSEIQERGDHRLNGDAGAWMRLVEQRRDTDPIRMFFTAGTANRPKGLELSSRNLITPWGDLFSSLGDPPGPRDRSVSYMPLAHVGETVFSVVLPILYGSVPHFAEDEDAVNEALVEVSPTLLLAFPRVLELYASKALIDLETGSGLKRRAYRLAVKLRRGARGGAHGGLGGWLAYQLLFRHLLNTFGFRKIRLAFTGGAPVSPEVLRLWHEWGVPLREFYGLTECSGIATAQLEKTLQPGTAGTAAPGVDVRVSGDGEILVRGTGVFSGYVTEAETASEVDGDGWLCTGDLGEASPDGDIRILGRKGDVFSTASGQVVVPSELEHALKYGPYVRDAMVVGEGRSQVCALLGIDVENVSQWARGEKIMYTSTANLASNPKVSELLQRSVDEANARLAEGGNPHRIAVFRVLPAELEGGDEITPTRTLKRPQLTRKYAALIDEMYGSQPHPSDNMGRSANDVPA